MNPVSPYDGHEPEVGTLPPGYEIHPHGERFGFPGRVTLYRNGAAIRHFETEQGAIDWTGEHA